MEGKLLNANSYHQNSVTLYQLAGSSRRLPRRSISAPEPLFEARVHRGRLAIRPRCPARRGGPRWTPPEPGPGISDTRPIGCTSETANKR